MGTVTHQWRCRPVSLGQTCSERRKRREGKQRVQRLLEKGRGSEGEEDEEERGN